MAEIKLGGQTPSVPTSESGRFTLLLWGSSGAGKTTLAATAPGKKLWLGYDPDAVKAVTYRDDIVGIDYSREKPSFVMKFNEENPLKIEQYLEDNPDIETVVFDSLTTFGENALYHGVKEAKTTKKGVLSTLENPGYSGFGNKNTWTRLLVMNLLRSTARMNRHMIFIAHENTPVKDDQGIVLYISIMIGSCLNEQVPIRLSEIWHLSDTGKERRIAVRSCRLRKPMKSRMFITSGEPEFVWTYNADKDEGPGIADWYKTWTENGGKKIPLPV